VEEVEVHKDLILVQEDLEAEVLEVHLIMLFYLLQVQLIQVAVEVVLEVDLQLL
jgi:hypothetical protein